MKLRPCQLARWCDAALGRRKWLYLALCVLALLLSLLLGLTWLILPALLLMTAVLALYLLHRHHAFGTAYQRPPRPEDALCETVLIDASLIGQGTRLRAAAQPVDVAEALTMRLGSGTLLLGAAMTLTADALSPADRSAVLSVVQALNIKPDRMRSHNPVLAREQSDGLTIVTVRDGMSERRYFLGEPTEVARHCPAIWEGSTRPLTDDDILRIEDTARYIAQGNCRVFAWATALAYEEPVFLGMAGLGEEIDLSAVQEVSALRGMGLTVMLDAGEQSDADLESLRALLSLPDHHARADIHLTPRTMNRDVPLAVTCLPGESLLEPITLLRQRFRTIEDTLRRFALMLGFALLAALLSGSTLAAVFAAGLLLAGAIAIGVDLSAPRPRWIILGAALVLALLTRLFLSAQPDALTFMASGLVSVAAAFAALMRLCGQGFILKGNGSRPALGMLAATILAGAALLIFGLLQGMAALLPLGFAALISAAILLMMILENKILR